MADRAHLAAVLEDGWREIRAFFAERNWPDTKLGNAASAINGRMSEILDALRRDHKACKARSCSHRHDLRRPGADLLDGTRQSAEYWLTAGRSEKHRDEAVMFVEQAMNHWKNAAYALAEKVAMHDRAIAPAKVVDPCSALCRECKGDGICMKNNPVYKNFARQYG